MTGSSLRRLASLPFFAVASLCSGCAPEEQKKDTRFTVEVVSREGVRLEGAEILGESVVRSRTGENSVISLRDAPRVACPEGFEREPHPLELDRERRFLRVRCDLREVKLALGVLTKEGSEASVVLDGREVGKTLEGVLATVVTVPARSDHELSVFDSKDGALLGASRVLRVERTDNVVVVDARGEVRTSERHRLSRNASKSVKETRPYRVGR